MSLVDDAVKRINDAVGYDTNHDALYKAFKEMARQAFGAMFVGAQTWPNMTPAWAATMNRTWTDLHAKAISVAETKQVSSYSYGVVKSAWGKWTAAYELHGANLLFGSDKLAHPDLLWIAMHSLASSLDIITNQVSYSYTLSEVATEASSDLVRIGSDAAKYAAQKITYAANAAKDGATKLVTTIALGAGIVIGGYYLLKKGA